MQEVEAMLRKLRSCIATVVEANRAGASNVLDRFSWIKIMKSDSSVYILVSADGVLRGHSRLPDGVKLPQTDDMA
jgi:hypothetical protein